jgi:hypothetical protein
MMLNFLQTDYVVLGCNIFYLLLLTAIELMPGGSVAKNLAHIKNGY